jgi:hypothetical protein
MTDVREPNSAATGAATTTTTTTSTAAPASPDEALHKLYRMSRTAGLGSGDYVAISNTAILALVLGALSLLATLYPLMIVVAVGAVICGILALRQIRNSNGTQTGIGIAIVAILCGLGFGGAAIGKTVMQYFQDRRDEQAIGQVVQRLNDMLVSKPPQYAQAYRTLFSDDFKRDFSEQDFTRTWETFTVRVGDVQAVGWANHAEFASAPGSDVRHGYISSTVKFANREQPASQVMQLIRSGDNAEWQIAAIQQLFEKPKAGRGGEGEPQQPQQQPPGVPELMKPPGSTPGGLPTVPSPRQ